MPTAPTARLATRRDVRYIADLARKFTNEVGFLPAEALNNRLIQGNVLLALENGSPAGYLLGAEQLHGATHIRPIFQAAIQFDAQRRHHGLALLNILTLTAVHARQTMLQCYCRQGLDANSFWKAAGFIAVALRDVNARRGEPCTLWRKPLVKMTAETLLFIPPNAKNQGGAGRSYSRFNWSKLPLIETFAPADVHAQLGRLSLAA